MEEDKLKLTPLAEKEFIAALERDLAIAFSTPRSQWPKSWNKSFKEILGLLMFEGATHSVAVLTKREHLLAEKHPEGGKKSGETRRKNREKVLRQRPPVPRREA